MKKICLFFLFLPYYSSITAQDSTRFIDKIKLSWESNDYYAPQKAKTYLIPKSIEDRRNYGKYVRDNPLFHGATAFGLRVQTEIIKNYAVDVRFMAEHRGISYGVFNTSSMIIYPIFKFSFVDTLKWKEFRWIVSGNAGQERNFTHGEGLYLYNLNCHAENLRIQVLPNLAFEAFHIGDLANGIGLGLDEVYQGSIIFRNDPLSKKDQKWEVQLALTQWENFLNNNYRKFRNPANATFLPELAAHLYINPNLKIYGHVAFNAVNKPYQIDSAVYYSPKNLDKIAGVFGANWQKKTDKLRIETVFEARFYGKAFNFEHSDQGSFYRGYRWGSYNETIGQNLYTLESYDRPFSQWGVFTEYYHKNVGGLTLRTKGNQQIHDAWHLYFDIDENIIFAEGEKPFNYLFVSTGINYKFRKDIDAGIGLTNKGMNLDVFYPTLY
jgi:hypothetical protein